MRRSLVAILAPDARVIAASSGNLKGGDFAKTAAVKAALASKGTFTGVWSLDGTIVNVAVRTITLGDQILAVLVVGAAVDDELLRDVERVSTVRGAVAVGPNILASSGSVEDFRPHIDIAAGQTVRRGNFVVRTERIAPRAAGARAVWRCAATNGTKRGVILLFPVVAAFGFGVMQARRMDGGF